MLHFYVFQNDVFMVSLEEVSDLIHYRRSIFPATYTGELVADTVVHQILTNANQAPSHRHTEPWRFHVISGDARESLADFFQETYQRLMIGDQFKEIKFKKLRANPLKSSHIIILNMQRCPQESVPEWEEVAAVACAIQNIYLSVTAAGLGGYWSSPKLLIDQIHHYIDMVEGERCLGFFYIGVPIKEVDLGIIKKPLEEKAKWYR